MITPDYARRMARYNAWQNDNLMRAAATLDAAQRQLDRGAFFGSIQRSFGHLLWADTMWMSRFGQCDAPGCTLAESPDFAPDWETFEGRRLVMDTLICTWARDLQPDDIAGDLEWYSGAAEAMVRQPRSIVMMHVFNHQTHHRGQIHAMLTAAGARPGPTDLFLMDMAP